MIACTSPALMDKLIPLRISLPSTPACRFLISKHSVKIYPTLPSRLTSMERLRFHCEFHRQLAEHFLAEAVHNHVHRVLRLDAAGVAVKNLVLTNLRGGRLVLEPWAVGFFTSMYGKVCAPQRLPMSSESHCVKFLRALGSVLAHLARDHDNCSARVPAEMPLLIIVLRVFLPMCTILVPVSACCFKIGQRHGVKFAHRTVATQNHARIFPSDGRGPSPPASTRFSSSPLCRCLAWSQN